MKNNYLKLGKIIRNEREEKGFSRRKLSALVDISDTELKRIENGERQVPNIITLIKLCKILKLDLSSTLKNIKILLLKRMLMLLIHLIVFLL